jgi:hypothetical protein
LVVGFGADQMIKKCPPMVRIVENPSYEYTNEAEQLRIALNCVITPNVLVIGDDVLFNYETLHKMDKNVSCIFYDSQEQLDPRNVGVTVVNDNATAFSYEIPTKWCHIAYLTEKDMGIVKTLCNQDSHSRLYFFEILNILLNKSKKIRAMEPTNMSIFKIDTSKQLFQIQE